MDARSALDQGFSVSKKEQAKRSKLHELLDNLMILYGISKE